MTYETDPHGIDQHSPGAKLDRGKNMMGLVLGGFSLALWGVGMVGTYGAIKYSPNGWKEVPHAIPRYLDAGLRHIFKHLAGELRDPETEQLHLSHAAWNLLACVEVILRDENKAKTGE